MYKSNTIKFLQEMIEIEKHRCQICSILAEVQLKVEKLERQQAWYYNRVQEKTIDFQQWLDNGCHPNPPLSPLWSTTSTYMNPISDGLQIGAFMSFVLFIIISCKIEKFIFPLFFLLLFIIEISYIVYYILAYEKKQRQAYNDYVRWNETMISKSSSYLPILFRQINKLKYEIKVLEKIEKETENTLVVACISVGYKLNYTSLPALTSILHYYDTGICNTLTGPFGAYARYDNEAQTGIIITTLQNIENKIDQIISNQYRLYTAIMENKAIVQNTYSTIEAGITCIDDKLGSIEYKNTIAAHNTEVLRKIEALKLIFNK